VREVLQACRTKFEWNRPGSWVTNTTGSSKMMKHVFQNHFFETYLKTKLCYPRVQPRKGLQTGRLYMSHIPRAMADQYCAKQHSRTKPTLLSGDLLCLSLCGIQLPHWLPWELEMIPDTRSPRTVNWHKIRHYIWTDRISRALLGLHCRSQWLRGLKRGSSAARLLGLWVRIPPGLWTKCCVLSGTGLCVGLITLQEESYRV
jgi:hypothetical protein